MKRSAPSLQSELPTNFPLASLSFGIAFETFVCTWKRGPQVAEHPRTKGLSSGGRSACHSGRIATLGRHFRAGSYPTAAGCNVGWPLVMGLAVKRGLLALKGWLHGRSGGGL